MLKAVFFDFDGTLIDTSKTIFIGYKHLFNKYRPDLVVSKEEYHSFLGPALYDVFPKYFQGDIDKLVDEYRQVSYAAINPINAPLMDGVVETLQELKKEGYKVAIITSRQKQATVNIINTYHVNQYFDLVIGYDSTSKYKPDKEPIEYALKVLDLKPDEVIMVGDHKNDILCASGAKVQSISYKNPFLKEVGASYNIDSIKEILNIINKINQKGG